MNDKTKSHAGAGAGSLLQGALGNYIGLMAALLIMVLLFGYLSEYFFSTETFVTIANDIPAIAVMAVGMTFVLIIAGIDLSVGSVMALTAAVAGITMVQWHWPLYVAILVAMVVGAIAGLLNGAISVTWRLPSFIVTLGMLEVARGGAYIATNSRTQYIGGAIEWLSAPILGGVSPVSIPVRSRSPFMRCSARSPGWPESCNRHASRRPIRTPESAPNRLP